MTSDPFVARASARVPSSAAEEFEARMRPRRREGREVSRRRSADNPVLPSRPLRVRRALYVQKHHQSFYYPSPWPRGEERSDEPCGHGGRPTTDRVSASHGPREAGPKPAARPFAPTVDRATGPPAPTLAFARQGPPQRQPTPTR